jgi:pimeloyl-ACP methyl ester carboxylesterase
VRRTDRNNIGLVIFIHGFRGTYLTTWGQLSDHLIECSDDHPVLEKWDYLFLGYETYSIGSFLDIAGILATQWDLASRAAAPFEANRYSKLALFGHSMGTLAIRQLLCAVSEQPAGMLGALESAVLFGSPRDGSWLAGMAGPAARVADAVSGEFAALLPGSYAICKALQPGNPQLKMLQVWNKTIRCYGRDKFCPTKVILGTDDHVVGQGGLAEWSGDEVAKTALDHSQLCKIEAGSDGTVLDYLKGLTNGR